MKYTGNYNLKKPEGTDTVNIEDFNDNADIIDAELKKLNDAIKDLDADGITLPDGKTISEKFEEIETEIGNIEELDTDTKLSLVAAINEINQALVAHKADYAKDKQNLTFTNPDLVLTNSYYFGDTQKNGLVYDGNFLYMSDRNKVYKINIDDFTIVATFTDDSRYTIGQLISDDNYLYISLFASTSTPIPCIRKLNKSNLSVASTSPALTIRANDMCQDANFIYIVTTTQRYIEKYSKSNLALSASVQLDTNVGNLKGIAVDSEYVYTSGATNKCIQMFNKNTLEYYNQFPSSTSMEARAIITDNNYVYAGSALGVIVKYNKNTRQIVSQYDFKNTITDMVIYQDLLYVSSLNGLGIFNLSDLSLLFRSQEVEASRVTINNDKLYASDYSGVHEFEVLKKIFGKKVV